CCRTAIIGYGRPSQAPLPAARASHRRTGMSDVKAAAGLALHTEAVRPEWIDYNGHMNVGYYVLAFDHATDALLDHVGLGADYRQKTGGSAFVVEAHVTYQQEVTEGTPLAFKTLVLGTDPKRIHLFHTMLKADDGTPV